MIHSSHHPNYPTQPILQVRQLSKTVNLPPPSETLTILQDVSFDVEPGEAVSIIGPSGSGKSTLLGLLAGLDAPSSGEVWVNGESFYQLSEDERARRRGKWMGFVFQSFHLLPYLTALENVALPMEMIGDDKAQKKAGELLGRVGLTNRLHHFPRQISGGEQQRVALARAFVAQPLLLFADEPTGNLDTHNGELVIQLMFEMNQEAGTTLVLVTHDTTLARRCDRVLTMEAGRLQ